MNPLKKAKGLEVKKVEIYKNAPFFMVYRNYEELEKTAEVLDDVRRKKSLPEDIKKNMIPHKKAIGQFNSKQDADNYVSLIMESQGHNLFYWASSYSSLGYDISFTVIHGKEAIKMVKRYSSKAKRALICEQIQEHDQLKNPQLLHAVLEFLYNSIQEQEQTGKYYEPF